MARPEAELVTGLDPDILRLLNATTVPHEGTAGTDRRPHPEVPPGSRRDHPRTRSAALTPAHLSVSDVAWLHRDPTEFATHLRRPMPAPPDPGADTGVAFHAWVERHYRSAALVQPEELIGLQGTRQPSDRETDPVALGVVESDLPAGPDGREPAGLARLTATFLASPWAQRRPVMLEAPFEMELAGISVRGRVDAVFAEPDGALVVVDWKSGRAPRRHESTPHALQLAIYRLAVAQLRGVPSGSVRACCYYAETGQTRYPRLPSTERLAAWLSETAGALSC